MGKNNLRQNRYFRGSECLAGKWLLLLLRISGLKKNNNLLKKDEKTVGKYRINAIYLQFFCTKNKLSNSKCKFFRQHFWKYLRYLFILLYLKIHNNFLISWLIQKCCNRTPSWFKKNSAIKNSFQKRTKPTLSY